MNAVKHLWRIVAHSHGECNVRTGYHDKEGSCVFAEIVAGSICDWWLILTHYVCPRELVLICDRATKTHQHHAPVMIVPGAPDEKTPNILNGVKTINGLFEHGICRCFHSVYCPVLQHVRLTQACLMWRAEIAQLCISLLIGFKIAPVL